MPLASAVSMAAPRSSSSFADSIRPSRAAYMQRRHRPRDGRTRAALGQPAADDADAVAEARHRVGQHPARRLAGAGAGVHVGALVEKQLDQRRVIGAHRHHQRGLLEGLVLGIGHGTGIDQRLHGVHVAEAGGGDERRSRRRRPARSRRHRSRPAAGSSPRSRSVRQARAAAGRSDLPAWGRRRRESGRQPSPRR